VDLHKAVNLRVVNDMTFFFELIPDILVTIAAKILLENAFYILQDNSVINQFPILGDGHLTGFSPTNAIPSLVVKTAAWNT
jgi:hypothetical protein